MASVRGDQFLPTSFEERGALVPFTTPVLAQARVRRGWRGTLELVVVGFSGGPGDYIIPWHAATEVVPMTTHDSLLYQEVMVREALEPDAVRRASLDVAKSGLAGPEVAEAASRALAEDDELRAAHEAVLAVAVVQKLDAERGQGLEEQIGTAEGRKQIAQALTAVANISSPGGEPVEDRMRFLNLSSYAVGAAVSRSPGRLRLLLTKVDQFAAAMSQWSSKRFDSSAEQAGLCQAQSAQVSRLAVAVLREFDRAMADPHRLLQQGREGASRVGQLANRLAWFVDGWDTVTEDWFAAASPSEKVETLGRIAPKLPLLPRSEIALDREADFAEALAAKGRGWARPGSTWGIAEPEAEVVDRIERVKARAM